MEILVISGRIMETKEVLTHSRLELEDIEDSCSGVVW